MSEPTKILHVFSRLVRGGAEIRTVELLRRVDRRKYRFHFCALSGLPGELDAEVRALGSPVHLLRRGGIGFARRFRALLRQHRFDVVQSQVLYYSGVILRLAAQCHTPIRVAQLHNTHHGRRAGLGRRLYCRLMRHWIDRYATNIVAVSEGVMTGVWGPDWEADPRCEVLYNGLETSPFDGEPDRVGVRREFGFADGAPLCIHVGSITPQKNHLRLVDVFAEIAGRLPAARLLIVGCGDPRLEQRAREHVEGLGISDKVVFCGSRTDVPRLLKAADVLIFPSRWEGLPGVVQEACLAGLPVVASDLPGVREIAALLHGVHILPLDAPDGQWAQTVNVTLTNRASHPSHEEVCRDFAASPFAIERCVESNCRIWQGRIPKAAKGDVIREWVLRETNTGT